MEREHKEGRRARNFGQLITSCPYDPFRQAKSWMAWCDGWLDRDYEIAREERAFHTRQEILL